MLTSCVGMSTTLLIVCGQLEAIQEAVLVNSCYSHIYQMREINKDNLVVCTCYPVAIVTHSQHPCVFIIMCLQRNIGGQLLSIFTSSFTS